MVPNSVYGSLVSQGVISTGGGYGTLPEAPPANGRVTDAIQLLMRTSDNVAQEVAMLEQRLAGVLRPASPSGSANAAKTASVAPSPLASGLEDLHDRLYALLGHLQSLTARVDI